MNADIRREALVAERDVLEKDILLLESKYTGMVNSHAWRATAIIRKPLDRIKCFLRRVRMRHAKMADASVAPDVSASVLDYLRSGKLVSLEKHGCLLERCVVSAEERERESGIKFDKMPLVSIVVPLYNTPERFLADMIFSVKEQTYANWELCLADASDEKHSYVEEIVSFFAAADARIRYKRLQTNGGISRNTNAALDFSRGEFVALLDHDDLLHPAALFRVVEAINIQGADFVYTDECIFNSLEGDRLQGTYYKPEFSPDTLNGCNYICHLTVFRKKLLDVAGGGLRPDYDGSQDHDLVLRVTTVAQKVVRVPGIYYFWRLHPSSTAYSIVAKPYAVFSGIKAVTDSIRRKGQPGAVESVTWYPSFYRVRYEIRRPGKVSIIVANDGTVNQLCACLKSLLRWTTWTDYEVIVLGDEDNSHEQQSLVNQFAENRDVHFVQSSPSGCVDAACQAAKGEYLVFLSSRAEICTLHWIEELMMYAQRDDVGAVGCKVLESNDTIRNVGFMIGVGNSLVPVFQHGGRDNSGYNGRAGIAVNVSAVSGECMMIRASTLDLIHGFDREFVSDYKAADLCLRLRENGFLVVMTPFAEVRCSSDSGSARADAIAVESSDARFRRRWKMYFEKGDPYYNPCFLQHAPYYVENEKAVAIEETLRQLKCKHSALQKMYDETANSTCWRLSAPLRRLMDTYKRWKQCPQEEKDSRVRRIRTTATTPLIDYDSWYEDEEDFTGRETDIKALAFYLPQFHTFPENDAWWGKGFTEWTNTRKARPCFVSHYQPREPHDDIGYYDLSDWRVMKRQAEMAKRHGIYGFCFYHYWFSGKRLMEKPVDQLLEHPEIDIHFCLCWANENWSRKWDGADKDILIAQDYKNDSVQYIADLKRYLMDPRYIRVNGKPVVMIYRPSLLPDAAKTFACWRQWARENGIGEIEIWIQRGCANSKESCLVGGADAEVEFPPSQSSQLTILNSSAMPPMPDKSMSMDCCGGTLYSYAQQACEIVAGRGYVEAYQHPVYRGIMLGWDNSARRKTFFDHWYGFSLAHYYNWLCYLVDFTRRRHPEDRRFIFINAWNEWAEGTYLEPDRRFGYSSINVTSRALFGDELKPKRFGAPDGQGEVVNEPAAYDFIAKGLPVFPCGLYWTYSPELTGRFAAAWQAFYSKSDSGAQMKALLEHLDRDRERSRNRIRYRQWFSDEVGDSFPDNLRVAVHLHLFYPDMLPLMISYLEAIPCDFDMFISVQGRHKARSGTFVSMMQGKLPRMRKCIVEACPNRGRDIAPFLVTFGRRLMGYDVVGHLQTKKSPHRKDGDKWLKFVLDHMLGSKEICRKVFSLLAGKANVVAPPDFDMMYEEPSGWGSDMNTAQKLADDAKLDIDLMREFPYCEFSEGSMFWARGRYLKPLVDLGLEFADFPPEPIVIDGTVAHALERLFFLLDVAGEREIVRFFLSDERSLAERNRF